MNRDDILRMARESGGLIHEVDWCFEIENLERFVSLAYEAGRKDENEACAQIAAYLLKLPENDISAMMRRRMGQ